MRDDYTARAVAREAAGMVPELVERLAIMETLLGRRLKVTSGLRPTDKTSAHGDGTAADLAVSNSSERFEVVKAAFAAGISRIGAYDAHVHVDVCDKRPQSVLWIGLSR